MKKLPLLTMATLAILCSVPLLSGCSTTTTPIGTREERKSTYDRVVQSGHIRCGYVVYSPGCMKDPNSGKLYGIGPETIEKIAGKLGLQVDWTEEVGWGSMLEGLQAGRYDMVVCPVWTNANRAKLADFSKPLFYSPIYAYVKQGNHKFDKSLKELNSDKVSIATIDGETAEVVAASDFPNAKKVSLPQLTDVAQLLLTVSTGKADVTFTEPAIATGFLKSNPNSIEQIPGQRPVRIFPNCYMFNRNQGEFKAMLDTVLEEVLNDGTVDKIVTKHEPAPNTLYRVAPAYQRPYIASTPNKKSL